MKVTVFFHYNQLWRMPILLSNCCKTGSLSYHILNLSHLEEEWPSAINEYEDFLIGALEGPWFLSYIGYVATVFLDYSELRLIWYSASGI